MTELPDRPLVEGTLADLVTLMQDPPNMRRGATYLLTPAAPAAGAQYTYTVDNAWWERIVSLYFQFTASAAVAARAVSLQLQNADGTVFNITPAIAAVLAGETWTVSGDLNGTPGGLSGDSASAAGTAAAPAAGAVIASAAVGPGEFTIQWNVSLSGTVAAADQNNFKVTTTAVNWGTSDNPGAVGGPWLQAPVTIQSPAGGTTVAVKAVGAATAGSVYDAAFSATPAGAAVTYPELPNIVLRSGWKLAVVVAGIQAADQISSIAVLTERYPSNVADGGLYRDVQELAERLSW